MTANRLARCAAAALLLLAALFPAGCKSSGASATTAPPERPRETPSPQKVAPPAASRYAGWSLRIKPARGPEVILQEPAGAELVLDAYECARMQVPNPVGKYENRLVVQDAQGRARYSFTLASDGQLLFRSADGRAFRMPEYIYYLMEEQLWSFGGSLCERDLAWQPDSGTSTLELELPRLIKAAMLPAFGYAPVYFANYTIYGVNTSTRDVAKVYLLLTYAGYGMRGSVFEPSFLYTTPATLIFRKTEGAWRLADLKQAPEAKEPKDLYNNVRSIFPYDYMETVLDDLDKLKDLEEAAPQVQDIVKQASEYLNDVGIMGMTVNSR